MRPRRGQAAVELALVLPLLLALLLLGVEFALLAAVIHWDTLAAVAAARAVQTGGDARAAARLLLDGGATRRAVVTPRWDRASVRQPWGAGVPGTGPFLGSLDLELTVVLGPREARYEGRTHPPCTDNDRAP